jgi:hypothetical protein
MRIFDFYISELRIEPVKYRLATRICSLAASQNTGEGDTECLATLRYRHMDETWGVGNIAST